MKYSNKFFATVLSIGFAVLGISVRAGEGAIFTNKENIAISGYDAVAYFTENKAVRGRKAHAATYYGTEFWFSNEENKQKFEESPSKFLPEYGGFCAFAMGMKNAKVPSDPKTFNLYNGKLYLFFNDFYQGEPMNTIVPWNANEEELYEKAESNWKAMSE